MQAGLCRHPHTYTSLLHYLHLFCSPESMSVFYRMRLHLPGLRWGSGYCYLYVLLELQSLVGLEGGRGTCFELVHDKEVLYSWTELKICVHLVLGQPETGITCKFVAPINRTLTFNLFSEEKRCLQSHSFACASTVCLSTQ